MKWSGIAVVRIDAERFASSRLSPVWDGNERHHVTLISTAGLATSGLSPVWDRNERHHVTLIGTAGLATSGLNPAWDRNERHHVTVDRYHRLGDLGAQSRVGRERTASRSH
jgi:hypothetical protein